MPKAVVLVLCRGSALTCPPAFDGRVGDRVDGQPGVPHWPSAMSAMSKFAVFSRKFCGETRTQWDEPNFLDELPAVRERGLEQLTAVIECERSAGGFSLLHVHVVHVQTLQGPNKDPRNGGESAATVVRRNRHSEQRQTRHSRH